MNKQPDILLLGANGQLGSTFRNCPELKERLIPLTRAKCDITSPNQLKEFVAKLPDLNLIINCAAATDVEALDGAPDRADLVNRLLPATLSAISNDREAPLIHFSTDYVFDGRKKSPYTESDETNPLNIYGKSKRAGEEEILRHCKRAAIFRTAWIISEGENNFLSKIIKRAKSGTALTVVNDQTGTPTSASDLASMVEKIIPQLEKIQKCDLYHLVNAGEASWYDLAETALECTGLLGSVSLTPILTENFGSKVVRPKYSVLSTKKIEREFGLVPRPWQEAVKDILE
ncbi:MAG TPA: dTDP-4-dehydrorhamnose reductase [Alphaproteobacteria bacterium]|mgnify:CR=1 FL=1|nr:dTDP-4-dehydrorhamnose reductase [Alphaproteobacteria bacterium]HOO51314.1 dTDP-4-dehydrorhamnose reductase [Alphaproteobacteria bacterium]